MESRRLFITLQHGEQAALHLLTQLLWPENLNPVSLTQKPHLGCLFPDHDKSFPAMVIYNAAAFIPVTAPAFFQELPDRINITLNRTLIHPRPVMLPLICRLSCLLKDGYINPMPGLFLLLSLFFLTYFYQTFSSCCHTPVSLSKCCP